MPSSWLNVPHFQQELEYSCVAACARMVLAHHGDIRTEAELRLLLDTQSTGTRAGNLMRLSGDSGAHEPAADQFRCPLRGRSDSLVCEWERLAGGATRPGVPGPTN